MDNITSGSIVEPRIAQPSKSPKPKALLIVSILEAVIIVGLIIGLIVTILSTKTESGDYDGEISEMDEAPAYNLKKNDANTLAYIHAVTNDSVFNGVIIPSSVCASLQKIYNSFPNDDSVMVDNPCQNQQIILFSADEIDSDLAARGVSHVGVVIGGRSYNYYIYSDFSAIEYLSEDNESPTATITFNVGS